MMRSIIIFVFFILSLSGKLFFEDFSSKNISYNYNPNAELISYYKVLSTDSLTTIYLKLKFRSELYELADYIVLMELKNSYNERLNIEFDTLLLTSYIISKNVNQILFKFDLDNVENKKLLVLRFINQHNQKEFYFDINIDREKRFGSQNLFLVSKNDLPIFSKFIIRNDSFKISTFPETSGQTYWYLYRKNFEVAIPPMAIENSKITPSLEIDSTFVLSDDRLLSSSKSGLYFVQTDSATVNGISFRIENKYFPKAVTINELINSLRYFSTRSEWKKLRNAKDKKKALDNYWMQVTRSEQRAVKIIKNYFERVRLANLYFTNYKRGWKTDMGMIYIVFGKPRQVYRSEDGELWIYEKNEDFPKLRFSFAKVPNIFTNDHYVLIREKSYQNYWFKAVDKWRKGRIESLSK